MNDKMIIGQYYYANSIIHNLDPRSKLFALILMMVITFLIPIGNFILLGSLFLFILIIILFTKVPVLKYLKSLRQIMFLLIFSFLFQIFVRKDGALLLDAQLQINYLNIIIIVLIFVLFITFRKFIPFKLLVFCMLIVFSGFILTFSFGIKPFFTPTFKIYKGGLEYGIFIIARVLIIILTSTTLTLTTKPMDLANALEWYLKPLELLKIKTSILAMMISIALRFIPTLFNETDKILKAQASRGVDFKEGKLHEQIKQIISMLVPMFVISFSRAIDLAEAMEARGYIPGEKRTRLIKLSFKVSDYLAFVVMILLLGFIIFWRVKYAI